MTAGDRKRNDRCRNKVCACTGECFVDDGTGDFAKGKKRGLSYPRQSLGLDEFCDLYLVTPNERNMLIDYLKLIRNRQLDKQKINQIEDGGSNG
jgi:hypothetical protein